MCKNHGPFTWGKDAHEAVHNAVVLEEVAKMATRCEQINPNVKPAPQELQDKHYYRKHGANAYYGQAKKKPVIRKSRQKRQSTVIQMTLAVKIRKNCDGSVIKPVEAVGNASAGFCD